MEKAEKILYEQERDGYRFVRSRFCYLFTFQKSTPRKVQYVFTYTFLKDTWPVLEWESLLKSDMYRGNLMQQGYYDIFRITQENVNLQDFYMDRLRYVRKTLMKKTIVALCAMLVGVYTVEVGRFFSIVLFTGALLALLSYAIGFYAIIQKRKAYISANSI